MTPHSADLSLCNDILRFLQCPMVVHDRKVLLSWAAYIHSYTFISLFLGQKVFSLCFLFTFLILQQHMFLVQICDLYTFFIVFLFALFEKTLCFRVMACNNKKVLSHKKLKLTHKKCIKYTYMFRSVCQFSSPSRRGLHLNFSNHYFANTDFI